MKTPLRKDLISSLKDQKCPEKLNVFCPSQGQSPWPANIKGMGRYDWDFRLQWAKEKVFWKVRRSKVTSWADSHRDTPVLTVLLLHLASLCSRSVRRVQGSCLWLGDLRCFYLNKQTALIQILGGIHHKWNIVSKRFTNVDSHSLRTAVSSHREDKELVSGMEGVEQKPKPSVCPCFFLGVKDKRNCWVF